MDDDIEDLKQNARLSQAAIATPLLLLDQTNASTINETDLTPAPTTTTSTNRGIIQPNQCNDSIFAIIFLIHFLSIM